MEKFDYPGPELPRVNFRNNFILNEVSDEVSKACYREVIGDVSGVFAGIHREVYLRTVSPIEDELGGLW